MCDTERQRDWSVFSVSGDVPRGSEPSPESQSRPRPSKHQGQQPQPPHSQTVSSHLKLVPSPHSAKEPNSLISTLLHKS